MAHGVKVAGRYLLGPSVGVGGMAQVYRAHDELLGRDVAVKLFDPSVDPRGPDRVHAEMRTLAGLSHPALVTLYDAGADTSVGGPPRAFLVMALIDGPSLAEVLATGPMPVARVCALGQRMADALAYVHSRGVVHRDIKPANILLDGAGLSYLADFGIAQTLGQTALTATGLTIGTAAYLSPEQVTGQPVTGATDIYALGLILLEALSGRREYPGVSAEAALARLSRSARVDPDLPTPWPGLLAAMTALDPHNRPTASGVALVLRGPPGQDQALATTVVVDTTPGPMARESMALADGLAGGAPPPTRLFTASLPVTVTTATAGSSADSDLPTAALPDEGGHRTPRWRRRRVGLAAAAAVAVVAVIVAASAALSGARSPGPAAPGSVATSGATGSAAPPGAAQIERDLAGLRQLVTP